MRIGERKYRQEKKNYLPMLIQDLMKKTVNGQDSCTLEEYINGEDPPSLHGDG